MKQGIDWDIFDTNGYWNVQRDDSRSTMSDDEAVEAARAVGYSVDDGGYLLDAAGNRQPADRPHQIN